MFKKINDTEKMVVNESQVVEMLAKATGKWIIHFYWDWNRLLESKSLCDINKSIPFIDLEKNLQIANDGYGYVLCGSEKECYSMFNQIVGRDNIERHPECCVCINAVVYSPNNGCETYNW